MAYISIRIPLRIETMAFEIKTPIAFFIFNRPAQTEKVFERIKRVKPDKLLIIADGPRSGVPTEDEVCRRAREICERGIDWPCDVKTNYAPSNLGCKRRMSTGLDWVFSTVERAIILEDDCLPGLSFFGFCQELLERFQDDQRVMQICGTNVDESSFDHEFSYSFSKYGPIWGWASWRRAWTYYDVEMKSYTHPATRELLANIWEYHGEGAYREELYARILSGNLDTWDLQWGYAKYVNSGLSIVPSKNLISNIGYGGGSTHTGDSTDPMANRPITEVTFPLRHYPFVVRDRKVDQAFHEKMTPAHYKNLPSKGR